MNSNMSDLNLEVSAFLAKVKSEYFKPFMELSFVARDPANDDTFIMISNDDPHGIARAVKHNAGDHTLIKDGAK